MKKVTVVGVLLGLVILNQPITAHANSLSYLPTEYETGIPNDIYEYANIVGGEFDICPELLMALAERESGCTATAENGPCKGLMQVNANTHKQRFEDAGWKNSDWADPYKNMYVAASYLSELFETYEDVGIVLGVYHGESNAVEKGKSGRISSYTKKILDRSYELERINGK